MNNLRLYKILAFTALIIELIIFFVLFGKIRNVLFEKTISGNQKEIYFLLVIALIFVLFFFVLSILLTYKKESEENYLQNTTIENESVSDKTKSAEISDNKKDQIDIESYTKKILPKDDPKQTLEKFTEKILSNIAKEFDVVQGLFFVKEKKSDIFNIAGKYAYFGEEEPKSFKLGETLSGQVAKNKTILNLKEIPDHYVTILSGLGSSSPNHLLIIPIILNDETIGIIEIASFKEFKRNFNELFETLSEQIGQVITKY